MDIRRKIHPKTISDACSVAFILIIIPLLYWFEMFVVLPALFSYGSLTYCCHFVFGHFLMLNIVGNLTFTVLCDTSIRRLVVPSSDPQVLENWRLCTVCESMSPPRSWHCNICDTCILKRDHHCIFTACCIGHKNHRYFIMFLIYLFVATAYAFFYNNYFIWSRIEFVFPMSIVKIVFPLAIFAFGFDGSLEQFYLMLYIVTAIGMLFTGALCVYHLNLILRGCTANENEKRKFIYDLGWRNNLKEVLGDRWRTAIFLPYVKSTLPHDGVSWTVSKQFESSRKRK